MRLEIRHDDKRLSASLNRIAVGLNGNLRPVMGGIGGILESSTRERIRRDKTAPDGTPWAQWADSTRRGHTDKQGRIRGSLLVNLGYRGGLLDRIIYRADDTSVLVGTALFYGKFLQQGSDKMPARPFLGLSRQDERDIDDELADFLNGLIQTG